MKKTLTKNTTASKVSPLGGDLEGATTTAKVTSKNDSSTTKPLSIGEGAGGEATKQHEAFNTTIYIRTYSRDLPWLHYCLRSIQRFATGYSEIHIAIPAMQGHLLANVIPESLKPQVNIIYEHCEVDNDYIGQQWSKLTAFRHTDADYILFVDSDCIFTAPFHVNDMFEDGKPLLLYTPYSEVGDAICWKQPTENALGFEVEHEFMRRLPLLYASETLSQCLNYIQSLQGMDLHKYLNQIEGNLFSEFNVLGAFAHRYYQNQYCFTPTSEGFNTLNLKQHWSWGGLTPELKEQFETILGPEPFYTILQNGIAILNKDTHISQWVRESNRLDHDQSLLPLILPYITPESTVIDAGAYIGDHTIAYASAAKSVLAFEPNPEAYFCLEHNMKGQHNVILSNKGLSNKSAKLKIKSENDNFGMAYLTNAPDPDIECVTIDSLKVTGKLDFIKIDVEGFELNVLKGAIKTIEKHRPTMLIEINTYTLGRVGITPKQIFDYLISISYRYRNIYPNQSIHEPQLDLLCQPKEHL